MYDVTFLISARLVYVSMFAVVQPSLATKFNKDYIIIIGDIIQPTLTQ